METIKRNNKADEVYLNLLQDILENGTVKKDRTGTGTISVFGRQIRFDMQEGFPLLTSKQVSVKNILIELFWFLGKHMESEYYKQFGLTNAKYLVDNNCNIWCGDLYKEYVKCIDDIIDTGAYDILYKQKPSWFKPSLTDGNIIPLDYDFFCEKLKTSDQFAMAWGDLGPVYGAQWNNFGAFYGNEDDMFSTDGINQIAEALKLLKNSPDSRRILVSAWNPLDLPDMVLPPCHYGFQLYTELLTMEDRVKLAFPDNELKQHVIPKMLNPEGYLDLAGIPKRRISLMWNQRSVDTPLGLPYNIASYAFLLHMFAQITNMVPHELIGNLGDTHIYLNQVEIAKEQIQRDTFELPKLKVSVIPKENITDFSQLDFALLGYEHAGVLRYPLSN